MANLVLTYLDVSRPIFDALIADLKAKGTGVVPNGLAYEVHGLGLRADVVHDDVLNKFTVTVTHNTFGVPESTIDGRIKAALNAAKATA